MMSRKLDAYIEAERERRAIARAIEEEVSTPAREMALAVATHNAKLAYSELTGGQIGAARRILSAR